MNVRLRKTYYILILWSVALILTPLLLERPWNEPKRSNIPIFQGRKRTTVMSFVTKATGEQKAKGMLRNRPDQFKPVTMPVMNRSASIPCPNWGSVKSLRQVRPVSDIHAHINKTEPILTLFTTFRKGKQRMRAHKNTLMNWALHSPRLRPVLFDDKTDKTLLDLAKSLSWEVLPISEANKVGTPKLKPMFMTAARHFKSTFYGYSNGDIVFDKGLIETLELLEQFLSALGQTMLVGCRHNLEIDTGTIISNSSDVQYNINLANPARDYEEDYFIIANNSFPWKQVPDDIVVGRRGYDNFMVAIGNMNNVSVVDGSCSVGALHQMGVEGTRSSDYTRDKNHNLDIINRTFPFYIGSLSQTLYQTKYNELQGVQLFKRTFNQTLS